MSLYPPTVQGVIYDEQNNIIVPGRAITSSPRGSASSSPATSVRMMAQPRSLSIESSTGKEQNTMSMIMMSHHEMMQNSGYGQPRGTSDRCRSRNTSKHSSNGSGGFEESLQQSMSHEMSPGGYSMSNKSFCSPAEGDSPPSPMRCHKNGGGNNNNPDLGQYHWMKQQSTYGRYRPSI